MLLSSGAAAASDESLSLELLLLSAAGGGWFSMALSRCVVWYTLKRKQHIMSSDKTTLKTLTKRQICTRSTL
jgi:hypothetical protein